jgi:hypothetical protein
MTLSKSQLSLLSLQLCPWHNPINIFDVIYASARVASAFDTNFPPQVEVSCKPAPSSDSLVKKSFIELTMFWHCSFESLARGVDAIKLFHSSLELWQK